MHSYHSSSLRVELIQSHHLLYLHLTTTLSHLSLPALRLASTRQTPPEPQPVIPQHITYPFSPQQMTCYSATTGKPALLQMYKHKHHSLNVRPWKTSLTRFSSKECSFASSPWHEFGQTLSCLSQIKLLFIRSRKIEFISFVFHGTLVGIPVYFVHQLMELNFYWTCFPQSEGFLYNMYILQVSSCRLFIVHPHFSGIMKWNRVQLKQWLAPPRATVRLL